MAIVRILGGVEGIDVGFFASFVAQIMPRFLARMSSIERDSV
jgi:hypothetical protein